MLETISAAGMVIPPFIVAGEDSPGVVLSRGGIRDLLVVAEGGLRGVDDLVESRRAPEIAYFASRSDRYIVRFCYRNPFKV